MTKKKMMIVDDNEGLKTALKMVFEDDFELSFAASGEEALMRTQTCKPQVVLMDYKMSGLTGIQTLQLLREELPATQMVIMSAYDDQRFVRSAKASGAYEFVRKPFDLRKLRMIVNKAMDAKPMFEPTNDFRETLITQVELSDGIDRTLQVACL